MNTREVAVHYFDIVDGPDALTAKSLGVLPEVSIDQGKLTIQDLYKAANRDANGNMHLTFGKKVIHKVDITWGLLTRQEWEGLLQFIKGRVGVGNSSFYCKMYLPDYGGMQILNMYAGDRSATPFLVNPGNPSDPADPINLTAGYPTYWKNCQCNFIEI